MSERRNPKSSIGDPVLLQNKAFLPCHTKTELRRYTIAQDQATDNVIVSLAKEAAADKMTQESIQSSYEAVSNQRTRKKRGLSALFLLINLVILAGIFLFQFLNEEAVSIHPNQLQHPEGTIHYRHYGRTLENMIHAFYFFCIEIW